MAQLNEETFRKVVATLKDDGDFFDPFYLTDPEIYTPLDVDNVYNDMSQQLSDAGVTGDEAWEVINFLQSYSDVNLLDMDRAKKRGEAHVWQLVTVWYIMYRDETKPAEPVIEEIVNEIDSGDAHLMTRNELVEFMNYWVHESPLDANSMIYDSMENKGVLNRADCEEVAKAFFIHKGYEK